MAIAHVSTEDYLLIGEAYTKFITQHHKASVTAQEWPEVLGADLFKRAVKGGYFGPVGTVPGLDYGVATVEGAQVRGTSQDDGTILYELFVDGKVIATETGGGDFDTVAFAKRHGQDI